MIHKSTIFIISLTLFYVCIGYSQNTFQKSFGGPYQDIGTTTIRSPDNGFLTVGTTYDINTLSNNIYLIKLDSLCDTLWTRNGGVNSVSNVNDAQMTNDGGYIIVGDYVNDAFLLKTDSLGNPLWAKTYGGPNNQHGYSVQQTMDNGYIICGTTVTNNGGFSQQVYVIKTDSLGSLMWSKIYGTPDTDWGVSCRELASGEFFIFGYTNEAGINDHDLLVIKTDMNGDTLWTKVFGRVGRSDLISDVYRTSNNEFFLFGNTASNVLNAADAYLMKLNSNGDPLWANIYNGPIVELISSIHETTDGGLILTGHTSSNGQSRIFLMKTDSLANPIWTNYFDSGISALPASVITTFDNGYLITGYQTFTNLATGWNLLLIKTDSLGSSGCNDSIISFTLLSDSIIIRYVNFTVSSGCITTVLQTNQSFGGVVNDICNMTGVIDSENENNFTIFPIPTYGDFSIKFKSIIISGNIEIFDLNGTLVHEQPIMNDNEIELKINSKGVYLIKITDRKSSYTGKLIVLPD